MGRAVLTAIFPIHTSPTVQLSGIPVHSLVQSSSDSIGTGPTSLNHENTVTMRRDSESPIDRLDTLFFGDKPLFNDEPLRWKSEIRIL